MSKEDNDDLALRDKFAIEIFRTIIAQDVHNQYSNPLTEFVNLFDTKDPTEVGSRQYNEKKMERRIRAAYKLADMMRKVRLSTFD
jgi:hypothetical protein